MAVEFKNAFIKDIEGKRLKTPIGVLSWPKLVKADTEGKYADGKFKVTFIFPKTEDRSLLVAGIRAVALQSWPTIDTKTGLIKPWRDGDEKYAEDKEGNAHFKGCWYIVAKSSKRPTCLDRNGQAMEVDQITEVLYGGCKAQLVLTAMTYEQKKDKGVTFLLDGIKCMGTGTRFGGGGADKKDFDEAGEEAAADE